MLSCHVVKDLLPNYIDGLVSHETSKEVREHLSECDDCRALYENMVSPIVTSESEETPQIDFLKKIRVNNRKKVIKHSLITAVSVFLVFAVFIYIFLIGKPVSSEDLSYQTLVDTDGDWNLEMELINENALLVKTEPIYDEDTQNINGFVLSPRQMPELFAEGNGFDYGYDIKNGVSDDFQIILRLSDQDVVFTADDISR